MKNRHSIQRRRHSHSRPPIIELIEEEEDRGWKGQYGQHPVTEEENLFRPSQKDPDSKPDLPNE